MKSNIFLVIFLSVVLFIPALGHTQALNWVSQESLVSTDASWFDDFTPASDHTSDFDSDYSVPFTGSISASASTGNPADDQLANGYAEVTNTGIDSYYLEVNTFSRDYATMFQGSQSNADASASSISSGTFTAQQSVLRFDYSYDYLISALGTGPLGIASNEVSFTFSVYDLEDELYYDDIVMTDVYAEYIETSSDTDSGSGTIFVPVTIGHDIYVSVDLWESSFAEHGAEAGTNSLTVNYSLTAVPEPVSFILFIAGGATLGFRHFRKKRNNA